MSDSVVDSRHYEVYVPQERYYGNPRIGEKAPRGELSDPQEAIRLLERVSLKNPPFPLSWRIRPNSIGIYVDVTARLPDRDTGVERLQGFNLSLGLPTHPDFLLFWFEKSLRAIFMHEFEECFHVDDRRVHDPHKAGRMTLHDYNRAGYRR